MRFLALELDGRSTLDRAQQKIHGVVIGQRPFSHARAAAVRREPADAEIRRPRRWLQATFKARLPVPRAH